MNRSKPVLLVEDDAVDAASVKRAFAELSKPTPLVHLKNGEEALDYLQSDLNERPSFILLDLNMPRMNGLEFIHAARADNLLADIPVIVLTTSKEQCDISQSFEMSVAGYVVKAVDNAEFVENIRKIAMYWSLNRLPQKQTVGG